MSTENVTLCDTFVSLHYHRMASLMEKLFLKSVVAEFRRSGLEEATFEDVSWLTLPSHCLGCARVMHMLVKHKCNHEVGVLNWFRHEKGVVLRVHLQDC